MSTFFYQVLFLLLLTTTIPGFPATYFISPSGNDDHNGQSSGQALQSIRAINAKTLNPGDSLLFERGGVYMGTLKITTSGKPTSPIVISAYGDGPKPLFTGSQWFDVSDNGTARCPECHTYDNLILSGERILIPARYPNEGYITMEKTSGHESFTYNETLPEGSYLKGALVVAKTEGWVIDRFPILSAHNGEIHVGTTLGFHNPYDFKPFHGFFLSHHRDFLDLENEWYFDASTDSLFLFDTTIDSVQIALFDDGIFLARGVSHIQIMNIRFQNYRADGISLNDNSHILIRECDFNSLGNDGIGGVKSWSSMNMDISVLNCSFSNILNTAINLLGGKKARIAHNIISKIGLVPGEGMAHDMGYIGIVAPDSALIEWNKVDSVGYTGISISSGTACEIRYNEVSRVGLTKNDCGGIYCWNASNGKIHHNYVHNLFSTGAGTRSIDGIMNFGIYIDDQSRYMEVAHNTIKSCDVGIMLHNAHDNLIFYNTLYNNTRAQLLIVEGKPYYGDIVNNNKIEYNNFQGIYPSSLLIELSSDIADIRDFAYFNNNSYNHPYSENTFHMEYIERPTPFYDHRTETLTFSQWRNRTGQDINSSNTFDLNRVYGTIQTGENLIKNSDFSSGTGWWWDYDSDNFKFSATVHEAFEKQALWAHYKNPATFSGSNLGISNFDLEQNKAYLLRFKTLGKKPGHVKIALNEAASPFRSNTIPSTLGFSLTTEIAEHAIPFFAGLSATTSLIFHSTSFDGDYYLDDVTLQELHFDTSETLPTTHTKLFVNTDSGNIELNIPEGYVYQNGEEITKPISLAPFTSIVLKKKMNVSTIIPQEQRKKKAFSIYPNPAATTIYIEGIHAKNAEIISETGDTLKKLVLKNQSIDISDLPRGVYLLKIGSNRDIQTLKFIKE